MLRKIMLKASRGYPFGPDDFMQQVVGSAILTAPLLFTQEVWQILMQTSTAQSGVSLLIAFFVGEGALYVMRAEEAEDERQFMGITLRYVSLMGVSFGTVITMMALTSAPSAFNASIFEAGKVISFVSIFAVIGAATADNLI